MLKDLKRLDEALASYDAALKINPNYADAYSNRGNVLKDLNRLDEALVSYDAALKINPNHADAYWNKSLILILKGDYLVGWDLYEWRWKKEPPINACRNYPRQLTPNATFLKSSLFYIYWQK